MQRITNVGNSSIRKISLEIAAYKNQSYEKIKTIARRAKLKCHRCGHVRVHSHDASLIASFDCLMNTKDGQEESFARIGM